MLVAALLNKDYSKRPNIFDVAKIPSIKKNIIKFAEENNCKADIMVFIDLETKGGEPKQVQCEQGTNLVTKISVY
jgi:hypothetical protein